MGLESELHAAQKAHDDALQALALYDRDHGSSMTLASSELKIAAGSSFSLPMIVHQPGTTVAWSFHLDEQAADIAFGVDFEAGQVQPKIGGGVAQEAEGADDNPDSEVASDDEDEGDDDENGDSTSLIIESERVEGSSEEPATGSIEIEAAGRVLFEWSNTFSWINEKTLSYKVIVTTPPNRMREGLQANAEKAAKIKQLLLQAISSAEKMNKISLRKEQLQAKQTAASSALSATEEGQLELSRAKATAHERRQAGERAAREDSEKRVRAFAEQERAWLEEEVSELERREGEEVAAVLDARPELLQAQARLQAQEQEVSRVRGQLADLELELAQARKALEARLGSWRSASAGTADGGSGGVADDDNDDDNDATPAAATDAAFEDIASDPAAPSRQAQAQGRGGFKIGAAWPEMSELDRMFVKVARNAEGQLGLGLEVSTFSFGEASEEEDRVMVEYLVPGSPAALCCEIFPGDMLLEVDGVSVLGKTFEQVTELFAGKQEVCLCLGRHPYGETDDDDAGEKEEEEEEEEEEKTSEDSAKENDDEEETDSESESDVEDLR